MTHAHHDHATDAPDPATMHTAAVWDERYGTTEAVWSGNVNQRLAEQASDLPPGDALELGCGEGADAVWLAQRGWTVTASDVSGVVVDKNRARSEATLPADVAARLTWVRSDIKEWQPPAAAYDLVSMQFLHLPAELFADVQRRVAVAVRPGGRLLVVNHDPRDHEAGLRPHGLPGMMPRPEEIAAMLDPHAWDVEVAETQARRWTMPDGDEATVHDAVVRARRR
ncbi:class I SAM-dependent methyltransferase [Jatrophihabitans fulvus]